MDEPFYDRKKELNYLQKKHETLKSGELIVIYGRRRLGKTRLIKRVSESPETSGKKLYFFVNLLEENKLMESFSDSILNQLGETVKLGKWTDFFKYLFDISLKHKALVVIDEFQRLKSISPSFITELQNQWDSRLKNNRLMLVIVGSSIGMMRRIAISSSGALYGRKTGQMQLMPLKYADFREIFPKLTEEEKIERYFVFGGTPYYIEIGMKYQNLWESVKESMLVENAPLKEEPKDLLEFELRVIARYNSILNAISSGKGSIKEISDNTHMPSETLPAYIENLIKLMNIVEKKEPVFGKERMGRYVINDNFFRFWYRFILPNIPLLEANNIKAVEEKIKEDFPSFSGRLFEDVVKELFKLYNGSKIKELEMNFTEIGSWWDRSGNEIDIAIKNKNELVLGEVKWTNKPMDADVLEELMKKTKFVNYGGRIKYVLVSKNGFTQKCMELAQKTGSLLLDLTDIEKLFNSAEHSKE